MSNNHLFWELVHSKVYVKVIDTVCSILVKGLSKPTIFFFKIIWQALMKNIDIYLNLMLISAIYVSIVYKFSIFNNFVVVSYIHNVSKNTCLFIL